MTVVIDGTTGIDAVQNGTVTQADLAANVAGNGPAFSAYQSSAQTISSNTWTKVSLQTEEFDTANCFDTSTYRFTPNVAGYYQINAGFSVATSSTTIYSQIYKNGSSHKYLANGGSVMTGAYSSTLVYLNGTTDYVEFYVYIVTGQSLQPFSSLTNFSGSLVRAA